MLQPLQLHLCRLRLLPLGRGGLLGGGDHVLAGLLLALFVDGLETVALPNVELLAHILHLVGRKRLVAGGTDGLPFIPIFGLNPAILL